MKNDNGEMLKVKLAYLIDLYNNEKNRKSIIENKILTVLGQSTLYVSIISVFYATIFSSLTTLPPLINFVFHGLLIISFSLALISLYHSSKALNIKKDKYMVGAPDTVNKKHKNVADFMQEIINDYNLSIKNNSELNNRKGTELIEAQKWLKWAIASSFVIMFFLYFYKLSTACVICG